MILDLAHLRGELAGLAELYDADALTWRTVLHPELEDERRGGALLWRTLAGSSVETFNGRVVILAIASATVCQATQANLRDGRWGFWEHVAARACAVIRALGQTPPSNVVGGADAVAA